MKKRLDYIDMVKGIGILGIVVMHAGVVPERAVAWLSSFVTPLFFLVAGMLIGCTGERERVGKEVVLRKGRALLVPFWCFSLLYILRDVARMAAGVSSMEELKMEGVLLPDQHPAVTLLWEGKGGAHRPPGGGPALKEVLVQVLRLPAAPGHPTEAV